MVLRGTETDRDNMVTILSFFRSMLVVALKMTLTLALTLTLPLIPTLIDTLTLILIPSLAFSRAFYA